MIIKRTIKKAMIIKMIREVKEEYQAFFRKACNKFGINPDDIENTDDAKKKILFNYIDKNWAAKNETDVDEACTKKKKKVREAQVKFNHKKVMKMIETDKFLKYTFQTSKGNDKDKAEDIFKNHIVGQKDMEKKYSKLNESK